MSPSKSAVLVSIASLGFAMIACDNGSSGPSPLPSSTSSAPTSDTVTALRDAAVPTAPIHPHIQQPRGCRIIGINNGANARDRDGGASPLHMGQMAPRGSWIDLDQGAQLTAKETLSGRETVFDGPARFRACVEPDESWIAWGSSGATPGAGEAPGQDQWIVTPAGAFRYAGGGNRVTVSKDGTKTDVRVGTGHVLAWVVDGAVVANRDTAADGGPAQATDAGAMEDGWALIENGRTLSITVKDPLGTAAVEAVVTKCEKTATAAAALAKEIHVAATDGGSEIGELTAKHMISRKVARAACGIATLRVGEREGTGASVTAWTDRVEKAVRDSREL